MRDGTARRVRAGDPEGLSRPWPAGATGRSESRRRVDGAFTGVLPLGPDECLFRLTETAAGVVEEEVLQKTLAISSRESEVLLWVSRGKSNREIGEILTISPRTVDKHIAQIFDRGDGILGETFMRSAQEGHQSPDQAAHDQ